MTNDNNRIDSVLHRMTHPLSGFLVTSSQGVCMVCVCDQRTEKKINNQNNSCTSLFNIYELHLHRSHTKLNHHNPVRCS